MRKTVIAAPVTITNAGTAQQIFATAQGARAVIIQADPANTLNVYVGDSTVSASRGIALTPGSSMEITPGGQNAEPIDLSTIWADADTSSNILRVQYIP